MVSFIEIFQVQYKLSSISSICSIMKGNTQYCGEALSVEVNGTNF